MINRLKTQEFHFVLNDSLKGKIFKISKFLNLNMSKTIIFILEKTKPVIKKMHLIDSLENNKVKNESWNKHFHLYLTDEKQKIYKELKCIHKDNNTYSIAGELRYLLKIFIKGIELYGFERFLKVLKNAEERMEKLIKRKRIWRKKDKVRQLSQKHHLYVKYDTNYSVILIKLLN